MPSYADSKDGLHIDGVTDNRPAAVAGIQSEIFYPNWRLQNHRSLFLYGLSIKTECWRRKRRYRD